MGGRGTFAVGKSTPYTYETVDVIDGVKVLEKINKNDSLSLPEEAKSSKSYVLLDKKGNFKMYREYDENHFLRFEIGFHPEPKIDPSRKPVLHVHEYKPDNFKNRTLRPLSNSEYKKYKKFLKEILT